MKKTAFLTEPRKHKALKFVLENFISTLPKEWSFQINHGTKNIDYIKKIIDNSEIISKANSENRIILYNLKVEGLTHKDESSLSCSTNFWNNIDGDLLLKFECDTMLCPNSKHKISDFEKFDFIGGYWGTQLYNPIDSPYPKLKPGGDYHAPYRGPQVLPMNGALSIRKKQTMIDIVKNEFDSYITSGKPYEDDYFFSEFVNKPTTREVISFSIDNGYISPLNGEAPFGVHKPWSNKGGAYENIKNTCKDIETLKSLQQIEN